MSNKDLENRNFVVNKIIKGYKANIVNPYYEQVFSLPYHLQIFNPHWGEFSSVKPEHQFNYRIIFSYPGSLKRNFYPSFEKQLDPESYSFIGSEDRSIKTSTF